MKKFETLDNVIALVLTVCAGIFIGVSPAVTLSLAITYMLCNILAHDVKEHIVAKKLPGLYEGIGDGLAFVAIVLNLVGLKTANLYFMIGAVVLLAADLVLIVIGKKKEGKTTKEAITEAMEEVKAEVVDK